VFEKKEMSKQHWVDLQKKNIEHMHGSMEPKNKIPSHNKKKKSWGHAPALGRVSTKFMHG
jgi:hypothetical protein